MNVVTLGWYPANWPTAPTDPYFGLPLWLQTSCAGNRLWAYNRAHIGILRRYVGTRLRERTPNVNGSWMSRLPTWIKLAKHRERVLASLDELRDMVPSGARRNPIRRRDGHAPLSLAKRRPAARVYP